MPAAAVIPAPIAYTKVVAVKKLVVGFLAGAAGGVRQGRLHGSVPVILGESGSGIKLSGPGSLSFTVKKIRVFKAGLGPEYISME